MKCLGFIILFSTILNGFTQVKQAEKYIKDLASPEFHGRGYVHQGDQIAAEYIKKYFKQFGLRSFDSSYFQSFKLDVNTFQDTIDLVLNGKKLKIGYDFIIDPYSGSAQGSFIPVEINRHNISELPALFADLNESTSYVFIVNPSGITNQDSLVEFRSLKYALARNGPVIWVNNDKFTWSVAKEHLPFPVFELNDSLLNDVTRFELRVKNTFKKAYKSQNVIGYIPARKRAKCKKYKVITAHYDHLGQMGPEAYIPGANDNASGIAMLLNLAQHYSENPPKDFNVVFMAFGAEEAGLLGSKFYTENPLFPLKKINFLLNLDLQGTGEEGITVVNATLHPKEFQSLIEINKANDYLVKVKKRGEAANSDHYFFTKNGVPAFFIYTMGGISAYHDVYDRSETLPLTEFNDLFQLYIEFLEGI